MTPGFKAFLLGILCTIALSVAFLAVALWVIVYGLFAHGILP